MTHFKTFFTLERKRLSATRNLTIMIVFLLVSLIMVGLGVLNYNDMKEGSKRFKEMNQEKVKQFVRYEQYGGYGLHIYFMPGPLNGLFYNSGVFSELIGRMDVGEILNAYHLVKGKNVFAEGPGKLVDFSGFFLLLGSLIAMLYGFDGFRDRDYLRYLASIFGHSRVFRLLLSSRMLLLCIYFTSITILAAILMGILGIPLGIHELYQVFVFHCVNLIMLLVFFALGSISGTWQPRQRAGFVMIGFWLISVYFIPVIIKKVVETDARDITSNFSSELNKMKSLMDYEKEEGAKIRNSSPENRQKIIADSIAAYQEILKKIQEVDQQILEQTASYINKHHWLSCIFPSSFYVSVNRELSSRGHKGLLEFYKYIITKKSEFVTYYTHNLRNKKVEPFKGYKMIYQGKSTLPYNFTFGLFLNLLYLGLLIMFSFKRFEKFIFFIEQKNKEELDELGIDVDRGRANVMLSRNPGIRDLLFSVFSGIKHDYSGSLKLDEVEFRALDKKHQLIYLCHPDHIPAEIKLRPFILFIVKSFGIAPDNCDQVIHKLHLQSHEKTQMGDLPGEQRGKVLLELSQLGNKDVYMFDNLARGMSADFLTYFRDFLNEVKKKKPLIFYFTNDISRARKLGDFIHVHKGEADLLNVKL